MQNKHKKYGQRKYINAHSLTPHSYKFMWKHNPCLDDMQTHTYMRTKGPKHHPWPGSALFCLSEFVLLKGLCMQYLAC